RPAAGNVRDREDAGRGAAGRDRGSATCRAAGQQRPSRLRNQRQQYRRDPAGRRRRLLRREGHRGPRRSRQRRPRGGRRRAQSGARPAGDHRRAGNCGAGATVVGQGARRRQEEVAMFTHFFIDRPILWSVISILFVLAGLVAMRSAPIEQYPEMAPPSVSIATSYPGATAEVIANQVAAPIEAQLNGIDNLLYFSSTSSSSGNVGITVVFNPRTDPDINPLNVQNRVSQALSLLPATVSQQGVAVEKQSSSIMMVLSIYSPDERYTPTYIDNYTNLYVLDELKRVPGANRASVIGLPDIAMRVWLQPDRMAQLAITVQEVAAALQSQNQTFGIGQIGGQPSVPGTQQKFLI